MRKEGSTHLIVTLVILVLGRCNGVGVEDGGGGRGTRLLTRRRSKKAVRAKGAFPRLAALIGLIGLRRRFDMEGTFVPINKHASECFSTLPCTMLVSLIVRNEFHQTMTNSKTNSGTLNQLFA